MFPYLREHNQVRPEFYKKLTTRGTARMVKETEKSN